MYNLTLIPAYGRDYKSIEQVETAWNENKDFQIVSMGPEYGRMINKQDIKKAIRLNIRYAKQAKIHVIDTSEV